jgi:hypothetical protein
MSALHWYVFYKGYLQDGRKFNLQLGTTYASAELAAGVEQFCQLIIRI